MRWARARSRGAHLDCRGGVWPASEVEPIAEDDAVVGKPDQRRGNDGCARNPECAGAKSAAAQLHDADGGPGEQRKHPAVVAGENGGNENHRDAVQEACAARARIVVEGVAPLHQPYREPDHFAEKQRLGHRGGLEVEQVRIDARKRRAPRPRRTGAASGARVGKCLRIRRCRPGLTESARDSVGPPRVHRNERHAAADAASGSQTEPSCERPGRCESKTRRAMCRCATASP